MRHIGTILALLVIAGLAAVVGWQVILRGDGEGGQRGRGEAAVVAVEVAPVQRGIIRDVRVLSGTLEASTRFIVAPKIAGLLTEVLVDLGHRIERGQIVARIDDAEFVQGLEQAQAELAVRKAARQQSESALELARREYERALGLQERAMMAEAEFDVIRAAFDTGKAAVSLADAQVQQAEAALELARIRLGHTSIRASWTGGPDVAVVGERLSDAGNTIAIGDPVLSIVSLDPLMAVVYITERDYARLNVGQRATLRTDALPDRTFDAEVVRIAPVFRETSRQARIELRVPNPEKALKPGMFTRVTLVLGETDAETIVPLAAITARDGQDVVFVLADDGKRVRRVPVQVGITEGERAQVTGDGVAGRVVTLGQQLLLDGGAVTIGETIAGGGFGPAAQTSPAGNGS